jgi:hypothetical protein
MEPYNYDNAQLSNLLCAIITEHSTNQANTWLQQQLKLMHETNSTQRFNITFTAIPRFIGKEPIPDTKFSEAGDFFTHGYTLDRLTRVWWLLQFPTEDRQRYIDTIESLFSAADMNEQVALYGALPLLAYPEEWKLRTAEGIRSNIGLVLDAIMLYNPYPALFLDEPAWNQLVMKAFFTDKPVHQIIGLDARANKPLADILVDYAHERWAAGRKVNPMLWRLIAPFINASLMEDITRVWHSSTQTEKEAAALACAATTYAPAKALLHLEPALEADVANGILTWQTIADKE